MRTTWQRRLIASAILSSGLFILVACAEPARPSDTTGASNTPEKEDPRPDGSGDSDAPAAEPGESPQPEPPQSIATKLPDDCAALLAGDTITPGLEPFPDLAIRWAGAMLDPQTHSAVIASEQQLICGWGFPQSDAITVVTASVVSEATQRTLVDSLAQSVYSDATPKYREAGLELDAAYERPPSPDLQYITTVLLDGQVLVAVGQTTDGNFAADALRTIQQLNAP